LQVEGGIALCEFLTEKAKKSMAFGDRSSAMIYRAEAESVLKMVKAHKDFLATVEAERVGAIFQKKYPNFFERRELHQTAVALNKSEETVLSEKANLAVQSRENKAAWKNQKTNRNIAPARQGIDDLLNMASDGSKEGDLARCSRYCKDARGNDIQGRNCPVCHGVGHNAYKKISEAKCAQ
jgi:hypothetical protein